MPDYDVVCFDTYSFSLCTYRPPVVFPRVVAQVLSTVSVPQSERQWISKWPAWCYHVTLPFLSLRHSPAHRFSTRAHFTTHAQGHWQCLDGGVKPNGIYREEARDAANHPITYRTAPKTKNRWPKMSKVQRLTNPALVQASLSPKQHYKSSKLGSLPPTLKTHVYTWSPSGNPPTQCSKTFFLTTPKGYKIKSPNLSTVWFAHLVLLAHLPRLSTGYTKVQPS